MKRRAALIGSLTVMVWSVSQAVPSAQTQSIPRSSLEGQTLGWMKIYDPKDAPKPITQDGRVYSASQLSIARLFATWMQASYLPTGALGDVFQIRNEKLGLYNQSTAALPQSYGAMAKLYVQLKYDANKKIVPLSTDAFIWTMEANGFVGVPADAISTPEHYYFTLPTFEQQGYSPELEKASDVSGHPILGRHPSYFMRNSSTGNRKYVVLTKDHRLPYVTVTKGQYLDALGVAIARKRTAELKRITEAEQGDQKRIDVAMKIVDANTAKRHDLLERNRQRYSGRLQETAEIWTDEPNLLLENYGDVFEGNGGTKKRLPVYTIDPRVIELCKTDAPQWIVISWTAQLNDPVSLSLHQAMLNNVNVQYIYDYFFDPEKVKGQPYTPLRSPSAPEASVVGKASEAATKNAADPAVVFFDDFSSSAIGKKPLNWRSSLGVAGASSLVTRLNTLDGQWASMAGVQLTPTGLKTPLPPDFEVSYDVVAAQNYRWGAPGLVFKLSRTQGGPGTSFLSVKIRPGFDGRDGEVAIEGEFPGAQGYMSGTKWAAAPGFSNNAVNNRVTVTLKKKGDLLQVFVGGSKVAEYAKSVPAALQFDAMSFDLSGASPDDQMFVGNIRIARY